MRSPFSKNFGRNLGGSWTSGDTTAPTVSGVVLDDTADSITFSTTEGGTMCWAISLTATPLTPDGSGGWTEATEDEGAVVVATSGETTESITTVVAGGTACYFNFYMRDAAGNDSAVSTEAFTVNSASFIDDFNRANQALESSADWTEWYSVANGTGDIVSNQLKLGSASGNWNVRYECEDVRSSADQFAQITLSSFNAPSFAQFGLGVRIAFGTAPSYDGYLAQFNLNTTSIYLYRVAAGTGTELANTLTGGYTAGSVLRIEANGSTIRVLVDGTEKLSVTDTTYTAIGQGMVRANASSNASFAIVDDYEYGEL